MTDNEIIKALECCVDDECAECCFDEQTACTDYLLHGAINLINRQKAEIKRLQHKIDSCNSENAELKADIHAH